jgi:hypothetical protein
MESIISVAATVTPEIKEGKKVYFSRLHQKYLVPKLVPQPNGMPPKLVIPIECTNYANARVAGALQLLAVAAGLPENEEAPLMTFLKSLENIAKADDVTLDGIPIEKRTKAFVQSFFGSARLGHRSEETLGGSNMLTGGFCHPMLMSGPPTIPPIDDVQYRIPPRGTHYTPSEFPPARTEAVAPSLFAEAFNECVPYTEFVPQEVDRTWNPEGLSTIDPWLHDPLATSRKRTSSHYTSILPQDGPFTSYEELPPFSFASSRPIQSQHQQNFEIEALHFSSVPYSGRNYLHGREITFQDQNTETIPGWTPPGYSPRWMPSVFERRDTSDAGHNSSYQSPSLGHGGSRGISRFQRREYSQLVGPSLPQHYSGYRRERTSSFSTKLVRR